MTTKISELTGHKARHEELHKALDELVADFVLHTHKVPSKVSILDLIWWSYSQTINPMLASEEEEDANDNG